MGLHRVQLLRLLPIMHLRHVLAVRRDVLLVVGQLVTDELFHIGGDGAKLGIRSITSGAKIPFLFEELLAA